MSTRRAFFTKATGAIAATATSNAVPVTGGVDLNAELLLSKQRLGMLLHFARRMGCQVLDVVGPYVKTAADDYPFTERYVHVFKRFSDQKEEITEARAYPEVFASLRERILYDIEYSYYEGELKSTDVELLNELLSPEELVSFKAKFAEDLAEYRESQRFIEYGHIEAEHANSANIQLYRSTSTSTVKEETYLPNFGGVLVRYKFKA